MGASHIIGGRFEIHERIGQGGMGDVFRGVDTLTGDTVAIKSLKPDITIENPGLIERFIREGEALRKLNHPNIVKMLAALDENDRHYLVMEYVGGGTLADLLREQSQLPVDRVLDIALDLADALTRAHRLKIIHRDIKPQNVMLAEDGTPRLTDFGVAHLEDRTRVTESGAMIGTYAYLSPEACSGEELDARSDIWAFGVMLYEMLAGRRPYEANQPAAILTAILTKPVPDLLQFRSDAPAALIGLIYSMLEKEREKRIPSVRLVGAELEALIRGSDTAIKRVEKLFAEPESAEQYTTPAGREDLEGPTITPTPPFARTPASTRPPAKFHKQVVGAPRIFICYRRDDSIAITGRIYDRLVEAFSEDHVFKDVDKIPPGANFKEFLEREVGSCDILLAIIGDQWLNLRDQRQRRRLDDTEDFVRIEIEAALHRDDILFIPVLVNQAVMPTENQLPPSLQELAFRNAAVVRNDPDFNRDIVWLVEQINSHFEIVPEKRRALPLKWIVLAALLAAILLGALILPGALNRSVGTGSSPVTDTADAAVAPIAEGEYMVLVAQLEHLGGAERDITRFIVDDLKEHLQEEVPLSNFAIREYSDVITSDEEALAAAEASGASIIIWGNYDDSGIELEVQIGSLDAFPENVLSRDLLEDTVNVRVQMTDARRESVAPQVLAAMNVLHTGGGAPYEIARNLVILDVIDVTSAQVVGNSTAAYWHRFFTLFLNDTESAIEVLDAAIALDASNPIFYLGRGLSRQRVGLFDAAIRDFGTAQQLGPEGWVSPLVSLAQDALFFRNDLPTALDYYNQIVETHPDDWMSITFRGVIRYFLGQYDLAQTDLERAASFNPDVNFGYAYMMALALRQGRIADARSLFDTILARFPDPEQVNRIMEIVFGVSETDNYYGMAMSAVGNTTLRQWDEVVEAVNAAVETGYQTSDLYFLQGFAYCNLEDYAAAEAAYTQGIEIDPAFTILYALRAEVRRNQGNLLGAAADAATVAQSQQAEGLGGLMAASLAGQVNCKNFLDVDPALLGSTTGQGAETGTPSA